MQMIDDWVDQDEDRDVRLTPVVTGEWVLTSAAELFDQTVRDLVSLLDASGLRQSVLKTILVDLYKDYLYTAVDGMRTGAAACSQEDGPGSRTTSNGKRRVEAARVPHGLIPRTKPTLRSLKSI